MENKNSGILIDGRSKEALKIYSANKISEKDVRYTYENMENIDSFLKKYDKICLVLNDLNPIINYHSNKIGILGKIRLIGIINWI